MTTMVPQKAMTNIQAILRLRDISGEGWWLDDISVRFAREGQGVYVCHHTDKKWTIPAVTHEMVESYGDVELAETILRDHIAILNKIPWSFRLKAILLGEWGVIGAGVITLAAGGWFALRLI